MSVFSDRSHRLLEVSTSGYYAWLPRPDSQRTIDDRELTDRIRHHNAESRGTYGARRIHADLLAEDREVGVKRVAGLMRNAGLEGVSRRRKTISSILDAGTGAPDPTNEGGQVAGDLDSYAIDGFN